VKRADGSIHAGCAEQIHCLSNHNKKQNRDMTLTEWNLMGPEAAARAILPCCGSQAWAKQLAARRPFADVAALSAASDAVWGALPRADWQQAFDSHPRIGQEKAKQATEESLHWSAQEQSAASPDELAKATLHEGNRRYEERFGRIFIVCATGKSAEEMLAILEQRMQNSDDAEWNEAAEQQRQITQLRLKKLLAQEGRV